MLEWDASQFNEFVKGHERAVASIDNALDRLKGSDGSSAAKDRQRLANRRRQAIQDYQERAHLFWHGEEL